MSRLSWLAAVSAVALVAACAGNDDARADAASAATAAPAAAPSPAPTTPSQPAPAATAPTGTYTDAQLRSFIAASTEIDPLNRQLATATPEQRTALATQIRGILTRNNLDGATYNAIAGQAQTDTALAARINALRTPTP